MSNMPRNRPSRCPIIPERIRGPDRRGGFAFIPNRFLQEGFFTSLSDGERSLYLFLVLAGDRNGVSHYHFDRICSILELPIETYIDTRDSLIHKDLIAYDGIRFQVLSLPARPITRPSAPLETAEDFEASDPATIRLCIQSSLSKL
ncbi:hypothetical protein H8E07_01985 [bacterium]|nr:hypothetical protein [bacterium]